MKAFPSPKRIFIIDLRSLKQNKSSELDRWKLLWRDYGWKYLFFDVFVGGECVISTFQYVCQFVVFKFYVLLLLNVESIDSIYVVFDALFECMIVLRYLKKILVFQFS